MTDSPPDYELGTGDALIIVDLQKDFLPGGRLGVPQGNEVVPILNAYIERFRAKGLPVFATRDWHPPDHCSFVEQGGPWPPHCVAETPGAQFADGLALPSDTPIVSKATTSQRDAYSGFEGTDLERRLRELGVERVFVGGLATDYCVLNTVRDALRLGFETVLLGDAVRAVNVEPEDGAKAQREMASLGASSTRLDQVKTE